jgi:hypothetical protein
VATYGAESRILNKDIAKRLATFEIKIVRRMFGGIKVNNWRKRYDEELMQLFGDLDVLSFVRTVQLNWIGRINRMDGNRKVSQVFKNNPTGSRLEDDQDTDGGIMYKQILINGKLQAGKRGKRKRSWLG